VQLLDETTLVLEKLHVEHEEEKAHWQEECCELRQCLTEPAVQKAFNTCDVGTMTSKLGEQLSHEMKPLENLSSSCSNEDIPQVLSLSYVQEDCSLEGLRNFVLG